MPKRSKASFLMPVTVTPEESRQLLAMSASEPKPYKARFKRLQGKQKKPGTGVPGYVYVLGVLEGCHKIGASKEPTARVLRMLRLPVEQKLKVQIMCWDARWLEAALHRYFASKRTGGEWFRLTEEDLAFLNAIGNIASPADVPEPIRAAVPRKRVPRGDPKNELVFFPVSEEEARVIVRAAAVMGRSLREWKKTAMKTVRNHAAKHGGFFELAKRAMLTEAKEVLSNSATQEDS